MDIRVGLDEAVRSFERDILLAALRAARGNKKVAAKMARISYRQLRYLCTKHGVGKITINSIKEIA